MTHMLPMVGLHANLGVAHIVHVGLLGEQDSEKLVCDHAFGGGDIHSMSPSNTWKFEHVLRAVVEACERLAVLLAVIGHEELHIGHEGSHTEEAWAGVVSKLKARKRINAAHDRVIEASFRDLRSQLLDLAAFADVGAGSNRKILVSKILNISVFSRSFRDRIQASGYWARLEDRGMVERVSIKEIHVHRIFINLCAARNESKCIRACKRLFLDDYNFRTDELTNGGLVIQDREFEDTLISGQSSQEIPLEKLVGSSFKFMIIPWQLRYCTRESRNLFTFLAMKRYRLGQLQVLVLESVDDVKTLPASISAFKLCYLERLAREVKRCEDFRSLPKEIEHLSSLTTLAVTECKLFKSLPPEVGHLSKLECLRIEERLHMVDDGRRRMEVDYISDVLMPWIFQAELGKLRYLKVRGKGRVPPEIGNLTRLEELDPSGSQTLESLPPHIGKLARLRSLHLSSCWRLRSLPTQIGEFTSLEVSNLSGCRGLKNLPTQIGESTSLEILNFSGCDDIDLQAPGTDLPSLMNKVSKLRVLEVAVGKLSGSHGQGRLPGLGALTGLTRLVIEGFLWDNILEELGNLFALEHLIRELRRELAQLTNLKSLTLQQCLFLQVPIELERLVTHGKLSHFLFSNVEWAEKHLPTAYALKGWEVVKEIEGRLGLVEAGNTAKAGKTFKRIDMMGIHQRYFHLATGAADERNMSGFLRCLPSEASLNMCGLPSTLRELAVKCYFQQLRQPGRERDEADFISLRAEHQKLVPLGITPKAPLAPIGKGENHMEELAKINVDADVHMEVAPEQDEESQSGKVIRQAFEIGIVCEGQERPGHEKTNKMRQDVCSFGFTDFTKPFERGQIMCLCQVKALEDDEVARIYFFHEEGMACVVGVGLTYSVVTLKAKLPDIYVTEIGKNDWEKMWTTSAQEDNIPTFPILFTKSVERTNFPSGVQIESFDVMDIEWKHPSISTGYEEPEMEVNTEETWKDGEFNLETKLVGKSLLHGLMRSALLQGQQWQLLPILSQHNARQLGQTRAPAGDSIGNKARTDGLTGVTKSSGSEFHQSESLTSKSESGMNEGNSGKAESTITGTHRNGKIEGEDLFFRVEVLLNPHHTELKEVTRTGIMPLLDSELPREVDGVFPLQAKMVVEFFCNEESNLSGFREMEVTLSMEYELDSVKQIRENFSNWYHKHLKSSFKCMDDSALRRKESGTAEKTRLVDVRMDTVTSQQITQGTKKGKAYAVGTTLGVGAVVKAAANLSLNTSNQVMASSTTGEQTSSNVSTEYLKCTMFSINDVSNGPAISFTASLSKHVDMDQFRKDAIRIEAKLAGMLSKVEYAIWGRWELRHITNPQEYEVCVQRDLHSTSRCMTPKKGTLGTKGKAVETFETRELLQHLTKRFLISHSFDQTYYRSKQWRWWMQNEPTSPIADVLRQS